MEFTFYRRDYIKIPSKFYKVNSFQNNNNKLIIIFL